MYLHTDRQFRDLGMVLWDGGRTCTRCLGSCNASYTEMGDSDVPASGVLV